MEVAGEPKEIPAAAGLSVDAIVDPAGLLKPKGDEVAAADGAAAEDVVAGVLPNENADVAGAVVPAADFGALKLNAEAGETGTAAAAALTFGVVFEDPNVTAGAAGAAAADEAWLVVLNEDPNEFAEFCVLRGAMFNAGVLVEELLPAGALKLKADAPMDGEPEGVLKLNAELPAAGGVDGLLDAPNVISEAERLRELERSGGAINELISETCLLMVGDACDPKPGMADAEVLGELKLNALFVVGEEAEAAGSPNTKG